EKQPEKIVVSLEKEPVKEVEKKPEVKDEMVLFTKEPEKEEIKISNPVITVSEPPVSEKPNTIVTDNSEKELKISFDVKQSDTEFFVYTKKETAEASFVNEPAGNGNTKTEETQKENFNTEEVERLNKNHPDRVANLRAMSLKIKNKDGLEEIENTPAYIRRKVQLENNKPSSDSEISDLSIGSEDGDKPGIKKNPYIHDNPD
ncbi:MAG TPA: hypothetical protein PLI16_09770, partial [Bacteroidales bacterium]|nr:hypothetical protein [Bacteroidales bacterium]